MVIKPGRLHSALSLSGPTPANLRTCSGMSGVLPWSIRRWPRRSVGGARRQRPAGIDIPMLERKPRHPDEKCSSSCPSVDLCRADGRGRCTNKQLWHKLVYDAPGLTLNSLQICGVNTMIMDLKTF